MSAGVIGLASRSRIPVARTTITADIWTDADASSIRHDANSNLSIVTWLGTQTAARVKHDSELVPVSTLRSLEHFIELFARKEQGCWSAMRTMVGILVAMTLF